MQNTDDQVSVSREGNNIFIRIDETITLHEMVGMKKVDPHRKGRKKVLQEQKIGDDFHRKSKSWRKLERVIDRENNRYKETVTDSSGKVLLSCDEPLSEHREHGNAKNIHSQ